DKLWLEMYEPTSEADLAVHKKKVEDVRQWLAEAFEGGPSGKLRKYRRLLVLSGPAGAAKTATMRVLSREIGFEILEWQNAVSEGLPSKGEPDSFADYEGAMDKFQAFAARASSCRPVFSSAPSQSSQSNLSSSKHQLILLEDLPNVAHAQTQERFHAILEGLVHSPSLIPVVVVVSDAGERGESGEDVGFASGPSRREAVGVRSVVPPGLLRSPYATEIKFNAISATLMRKALQSLLSRHFSRAAGAPPSKDVVDLVVDTANGDIRSAIMSLQFACTPSKGKKKAAVPRGLLEVVSRREQSLAMFHLLGKVLYNKRKGDPPAPSASKRDIERDREFDARLRDPPPLPEHLREHHRRTSRVDVENYAQFCNGVEEAEGVCEALSWVDCGGGEQWYQTNPNGFQLLARGTLHALPTPVPRRAGQGLYKPEFFECGRRAREGAGAVEDVLGWLGEVRVVFFAGGAHRWRREEVVMELGGVLRARASLHTSGPHVPPRTHRLFSALGEEVKARAELCEDEVPEPEEWGGEGGRRGGADEGQGKGGWLEEDDIEE
ncbi:hypothetical protein GLOTRDRAFT_48731, partial [Gloeophyllum trabeum ATCC 11539]